jgi:hypothetical protein
MKWPRDTKQFPICKKKVVVILDNSGEQILICGTKKKINNSNVPPVKVRNSTYENPGICPAS